MTEQILFTPASLIDLLVKIDELKDLEIGLTETIDGNLQLQIGQSYYEIETIDATEIPVENSVADTVDNVNEEAYEQLSESSDISYETIESGIIKDSIKTLLIGGLVKLTNKLLK